MSGRVLVLLRFLIVLQVGGQLWFLFVPDWAPAAARAVQVQDNPAGYALHGEVVWWLCCLQVFLCALLWRPVRAVVCLYFMLMVAMVVFDIFGPPVFERAQDAFLGALLVLGEGGMVALLWLHGYFSSASGRQAVVRL